MWEPLEENPGFVELARRTEITLCGGICLRTEGGWGSPHCSASTSVLLVKEPLPSWLYIRNHGGNVSLPPLKCHSSNCIQYVQHCSDGKKTHWHLGRFLTCLISLRTKFWSSCQPYKYPMESLLICISRVHQNVCHLLPGNGFSHPRCKCVICDSISCYFSCPLCLEVGLWIWFSLRKWYKVWLLKWSFKRVLFYVQLLCWLQSSLPSPETMD